MLKLCLITKQTYKGSDDTKARLGGEYTVQLANKTG